jgi:hypothetical protein
MNKEGRKAGKTIPTFLFSLFIFPQRKFLLGIKFIQRKNEPLFETGGKVSASIAVKCQGTRCESGTVAPL